MVVGLRQDRRQNPIYCVHEPLTVPAMIGHAVWNSTAEENALHSAVCLGAAELRHPPIAPSGTRTSMRKRGQGIRPAALQLL